MAIRHVLGIETSCDETSAAVLRVEEDRTAVRSLVILSQDIHRVFGGVVPELASREHLRTIGPVVERALAEAGVGLSQLDGIAVTAGPGLIGALLVGLMYGKGLAFGLGKPLLGVHHLEGHLFAPTLEDPTLQPPFIALLVSGGHTLLLDVEDWGRYHRLGETQDDAAGEAFDKVGTLLGLDYPAGAQVERLAREGRPGRFDFPRPMLREGYDFSFSGLKTAVLRAVRACSDPGADRANLARGFQDAIIEVLVEKTARAVRDLGRETAMIGGGVACNRTLAFALAKRLEGAARVVVASPRLNTDNAAMIAAAGAWRLARGEHSGMDLEPFDSGPLPGLVGNPPRSG
ncbi:MAG TPA: tRNA (adenosine(37)-N6)-threonylcarbamoyltransferase complex transferase subunit TsaD [Gemmatimonadales bacterium]|nr:tRNA (adenosine(37)-N6)-threonylcarbamoyltransferase complex transferase subunit TsaD [Gemmatimonadales bacterium]